jgi:nucleoside-diphosphate-sugar epimerase
VDEFIKNGGQRLVGMGTCAEYDWSEKSCAESLSEQLTLVNPATLYGASKAGLAMILKALCALRGVEFAWGRLFFPYGPYEEPERLIPYTVRSLLKGDTTVCKHPDLQRDFIFIQDIAMIMASLLDSKVNGSINVASGQAVRLGKVVESIARLLNAEKLVQYGLPSVKSTDPSLIVGDITRLKNELGYTKITAIEEGLEKTVDWWKKEF